MSSENSYKKIDAVVGTCGYGVKFLGDLEDSMKKLNVATTAIAVPAFDKIYMGLANVSRTTDTMLVEVAGDMGKLCTIWGERSGFGSKATEAFEEAKSKTAILAGASATIVDVEMSDGLHENVSPETISAYTMALASFIEAKNTFIFGFKKVCDENNTKDTQEVFNTIGSGFEKFTNAIVDVLDANKDAIKVFGINLEDSISSVKAKASDLSATTKSKAAKLTATEAY